MTPERFNQLINGPLATPNHTLTDLELQALHADVCRQIACRLENTTRALFYVVQCAGPPAEAALEEFAAQIQEEQNP